ncbi:hypothetical protein IWQ61_004632 [Dispira simplex]|nr:hypothetical protein IWQ61_004632 [Dispira simplex]
MVRMWDFFGATDVPDYTYWGPVYRLEFKPGCKVLMPRHPWKPLEGLEWNDTIIFVHFTEAQLLHCRTLTQIIEQLPPVMDALVDIAYPPPRLAMFTSKARSAITFGAPQQEAPDNYFLHQPKGLQLALIGRETGKWLNQNFLDAKVPVFAQATHEGGPWNELLQQPAWEFLRAFTYITHSLAAAYAIYQLSLQLYYQRFRPNIPCAAYLLSLIYLVANAVCQYGDLQTNVGYVIIYISWIAYSVKFCLMVYMWVRLLRPLVKSSFFNFLNVTAILNSVNSALLSILFSLSTVTGDRTHYNSGTHMIIHVQPVFLLLLGGYLVYYSALLFRKLREFPQKRQATQRVRLLIYLCLTCFVAYVFHAISSIVMTQHRETSQAYYVVRYVCYKLSSLLVACSAFWYLRIDQSSDCVRTLITESRQNSFTYNMRASQSVRHSTLIDNDALPLEDPHQRYSSHSYHPGAHPPLFFQDPTCTFAAPNAPVDSATVGLSVNPVQRKSSTNLSRMQIP